MRHYEVMVILDPSLEERTVAPSLDTYLNVIRTAGGSVEKTDVWGRRRLAYEINKKCAKPSNPGSSGSASANLSYCSASLYDETLSARGDGHGRRHHHHGHRQPDR